MRKSVILLCAVMLLIAATVLIWHIRNQRPKPHTIIADAIENNAAPFHGQEASTLSPPPTTTIHSVTDSKAPLLRISVIDTAVLQRKTTDWWSAHGCNRTQNLRDIHESTGTLRQKMLNGDLTAANILGSRLIYDAKVDGRAEAKRVFWQAILRGSVCALSNYYFLLTDWQRSVKKRAGGVLEVRYIPTIPATDEGKRQAILDAYAWDLVYQMRTGIASTPINAYSVESAYHFSFQPTPAEYTQACAKAADLYNQLQTARVAAGYGPFDNSPPPILPSVIVPAFGADNQVHCAHWPVPPPQCQQAELHEIARSGVVYPTKAWVCTAQDSS